MQKDEPLVQRQMKRPTAKGRRLAAKGGNAKKSQSFSHQKIDAGSPECCGSLFFHDYIQMEKEEGSFVGAEVSSHSEPPASLRMEAERTAAETRLSLTVTG